MYIHTYISAILSAVLSYYALVQCTLSLDRKRQLQCKLTYRNDAERVATLIWEIIMFVVLFTIVASFCFHLYRGVNSTTFLSSNTFTKMVTKNVICFFIFWIPVQIANIVIIIAVLLGNNSLLRSVDSVDSVTTALIFINSCLDPFLCFFLCLRSTTAPAGPVIA